ncbi:MULTISPECIES: nitroreductase family protein [Niallia]|uniref:nitroreductase family protein n=1 Tax=Niallia TaxID=2837506 RepID=UPI0013D2983E|nr:nitroreductase family protein [Niallia circulans]NRG27045.1 nitroreductase family protein [Niallia circulans]QJX64403.1 nitroreductase [Niallia circulans]
MDVLEAIKTRRSSRAFAERGGLPQEIVDSIAQSILHSPSGSNAQESHFLIVQNEEQIKSIKRFSPGLSGDPEAVIVLCSNPAEALHKGGKDSEEVLRFVNLGIAAAYILLSTHSLGVGNCPVRSFHKEAIKKLLELPHEMEPELLISLGYSKESPRKKKNREKEEVISFDRYGNTQK